MSIMEQGLENLYHMISRIKLQNFMKLYKVGQWESLCHGACGLIEMSCRFLKVFV